MQVRFLISEKELVEVGKDASGFHVLVETDLKTWEKKETRMSYENLRKIVINLLEAGYVRLQI